MYLIVGLGNPEAKYEKTRHNIGFRFLDEFSKENLSLSFQPHRKANALVLEDVWNHEQLLLVKPQTFMNKSGEAVRVLYRKYNIQDWLSQIPGTLKIRQRHFSGMHGTLINPLQRIRKNALEGALAPLRNDRKDRYMIVVHDDIDLSLGKVKISLGASSAGHRGVESIMQETGTKDFARIRIGIQPLEGKPSNVEEFVLQKFTPEEVPITAQALLNAHYALKVILINSIEKAMHEYN